MTKRLTVRFTDEDASRLETYRDAENLDDMSDVIRKLVRDQLDLQGVRA